MQLRFLEEIVLNKSAKSKQNNGSYLSQYTIIGTYRVQFEEIQDEASVSIYGAMVNRMYRISSPLKKLEKFLKPKINDKSDNISQYFIEYNNALYKINAVKQNWVDIEYIEGTASPNASV